MRRNRVSPSVPTLLAPPLIGRMKLVLYLMTVQGRIIGMALMFVGIASSPC